MEEYYIGQVFEGKYPPEAADWCNSNGAYIAPFESGKYIIKAVSAPQITMADYDRVMEDGLKTQETGLLIGTK